MYTNIHEPFMTQCSCSQAIRTQNKNLFVWKISRSHNWIQKYVTGLRICADCESCSTLERAKTCRHQCTWSSVQLPEDQFCRTALMFKYDLFIALGLSQFSCSFFRDHYTITHSSSEVFFYEHWDSFILETERLMSRLTTRTMKLLNAQVLD